VDRHNARRRHFQGRTARAHDTDGFPTTQILSIRVARDGSVWFGTRGSGLLRYRSGQFRTYTVADGLPSANVNAIYEDSHGTLWIGTLDHGVGRFRNEHFDFASDAIGIGNKAVSSFLEDREGNLWIGSTNGLTRVAEGKVISFTTAEGLLADKVRTVNAIPAARCGSVLEKAFRHSTAATSAKAADCRATWSCPRSTAATAACGWARSTAD